MPGEINANGSGNVSVLNDQYKNPIKIGSPEHSIFLNRINNELQVTNNKGEEIYKTHTSGQVAEVKFYEDSVSASLFNNQKQEINDKGKRIDGDNFPLHPQYSSPLTAEQEQKASKEIESFRSDARLHLYLAQYESKHGDKNKAKILEDEGFELFKAASTLDNALVRSNNGT